MTFEKEILSLTLKNVNMLMNQWKFQVTVTDFQYHNLEIDFSNVSCRINRTTCGLNSYFLEVVTT